MFAEQEFTYNGIKQGNRNPLVYGTQGADGLKQGTQRVRLWPRGVGPSGRQRVVRFSTE